MSFISEADQSMSYRTESMTACYNWVISPLITLVLLTAGASQPSESMAANNDADTLITGQSQHWSFQPIRQVTVPSLAQVATIHNPIDAFILRRLTTEGLQPSARARRTTLIRRVYLDLIGLPPSPANVHEFLNDPRPDAYDRVVNRLLASPHYGERWARPWMDLCHYADTDGYLTDQLRPIAWRYRAWLVDTLNQDLPFDQFTIQQIAGDLLPNATTAQRMATGFLRQTLSNREGGADLEEFRVKQTVDRTEMVGTIWLGLTVGCARCHDHKFEEITQREFYQLYAYFNNADEINFDAPLKGEMEPYLAAKPDYDRKRRELIRPIEKELYDLLRQWELRLLEAYHNPAKDAHWDRQFEVLGLIWGGNLGEGQLEGVEIVKLDPARRTQQQQDVLLDYFLSHDGGIDSERFAMLKLGDLRDQLKKLANDMPKPSRAPSMQAAVNPRKTYIHVRGQFRSQGDTVEPNTLDSLPKLDSPTRPSRLTLAHWLTSAENPLTARVTVNRWWQELFGRGIVLTSEDFGKQGETPTHPALLDWLATKFIQLDWSRKSLHRLIATSATYQQSSRPRPELFAVDPDNRLLARQSSLRVPAETVRDLALTVSGQLSRNLGGPSVYPPQPARVTMEAFGINDWKVSEGDDAYRRGLYTFIIRTAPFAQAAVFDAPNPGGSCTRRERSNTSLQALTLLNDEVFYSAAKALAVRLFQAHLKNDEDRIHRAFKICLSRSPTADELHRALQHLHKNRQLLANDSDAVKIILEREDADRESVELAAWTGLGSVLLNLHEFITRD